MVRHVLAAQEGIRKTFRGKVVRFGTKPAYRGYPLPTILLAPVYDANGKEVCDHLWFTVGKTIANFNLQEGDIVEFDARVTSYEKGYKGYREDVYVPIETDYRLSHPTKMRKVENQPLEGTPNERSA